ncbi:MAG TPA: hypothetical protein VGB24_08445 [Longimicrobium sp.]|jgi:hypothetical protein|uniref:hypothetical protein n=1 Tax=Longimicrobium sp. TaxID=2029185 RepID=UPI002ED9DB90
MQAIPKSTANPMIFRKAVQIVRYVESMIIDLPEANHHLVDTADRHTRYPFKFLKRGIKIAAKGIATWVLATVGVGALGGVVSNWVPAEAQPLFSSMLGVIIWVIPVGLALFPVPSTYSFYGVGESHVKNAADFISKLGLTNEKELAAVRDNIGAFEERASGRTTALRWSVAAVWAGVVYFIQKYVEATPGGPEFFRYALAVAVGILLTAGWFLVVEGYAASSSLLYKTIRFALNEISADPQRASESGGTSSVSSINENSPELNPSPPAWDMLPPGAAKVGDPVERGRRPADHPTQWQVDADGGHQRGSK